MRNVRVQLFTRLETPNREGKYIVPLFVAYKEKLVGFRNTSIVRDIPSTTKFSGHNTGRWFVHRCEVAPQTELMIEYTRRSKGFGEDVEHLLLIADDTAPLVQITLGLPDHPLAEVHTITFEGRFVTASAESDVSEESSKQWLAYLGVGADEDELGYHVTDFVDANMDRPFFHFQELEAGKNKEVTIDRKVTKRGKVAYKINRRRGIKIR